MRVRPKLTGQDGTKQNQKSKRRRIIMKKLLLIAVGVCLSGVLVQAAEGGKEGGKGEGGRAKLLEKYDKNKDGKLDESEKEALKKDRQAEMLKKYDKNGDGKLDDAEKEAAKAARKRPDAPAKEKTN